MSAVLSLQSAAHALSGTVVAGAIIAPGPGHSRDDRSLSVRFSASAPGGFIVHSFAGDDPISCKDHVRACLGIGREAQAPAVPKQRQPGHDNDNAELARRIWQDARDPSESPIVSYLAKRTLALPVGSAGTAIRFHPACPFAGKKTPAMVALVVDIRSNEPLAVHRTALNWQGDKQDIGGTSRLSLGPCAGGAVKLTPDAEVTTCLGIGEGIESTLSLRRLPEFGPSPVWSLLNASGLAAFPVLAGIECLWIAEDHDPAGMSAGRDACARWTANGAEVFRVRSKKPKTDLNDLVRGGGNA